MRIPVLVATAVMSGLLLTSVVHARPASLEDQVRKLRVKIRKETGSHVPPAPVPANNPQTRAKVKLGEALFFDPNLSGCGTIACATCHVPEKGFSDGLAVSSGCQGATGRRNSATVYQTAYLSHLFWDGRVQSLEEQALNPVVDPAEMGNTWDKVLAYLQTGKHAGTGRSFPEARQFYQAAFKAEFEGEISTTNVTKALAAYERTVLSRNAPFDRWLRGDDRALTVAQKKGLLVFFGRGKCFECHTAPHFTDSDFHNIGVPRAGFEAAAMFPQNSRICTGLAPDADPGRAEISPLQSSCADVGTFRTPTLRNVGLTAPYMHNGALPSIGTVVEHYEKLAKGAITPVVGELDEYVRKGTMRFGAGGGGADDIPSMIAFLQALTGSQRPGPKGGVAPPRLK